MGNLFFRLIAAALLAVAADKSFAVVNPKLPNGAGSGQSTVKPSAATGVENLERYNGRHNTTRDKQTGNTEMRPLDKQVYGAPICPSENVYRAMQNADVPQTLNEMQSDSRFAKTLDIASVYHNLREDVPFNTPEERMQAYDGALFEYAKLLNMKKEFPYSDLSDSEKKQFKFLNPDMPNVKYVERSEEGAREAVYNKKTGELVKRGPNQGTWNFRNGMMGYLGDRFLGGGFGMGPHHYELDELRAVICGVPTDEQNRMGKEMWAKDFLIKNAKSLKALLGRELGDEVQSGEKVCQEAKPVSMDDLKKMNLDDKNGDWCQCANPGCVNTFKVVNGKHEGYLTFVCSHCKKVNVGFAREALKYEGIIKGEGGTPQWFGPNAEANAKAAGNVK